MAKKVEITELNKVMMICRRGGNYRIINSI